MAGSVNPEKPVYLNDRHTLAGDLATDAVRHEYNFRIPLALENVLMHSPVARATAALATRCVHHDRPARLSGTRIEMYYAAFQFEAPAYGVQYISESERYCGARGVEYHRLGLQ